MTIFSKTAVDIFAPTDSGGSARNVVNGDVQVWGTEIEYLATLAFTSSLVYSTRAALYANLVPAANVPALVIGDPTAGYDGLYMKVGATTTGSWTRLGDVPGRQYIKATDAGAGTANAIVATTDIPLPSADRAAIISLNIYEANTATPVTVAFNGGSVLTIKTAGGSDVSVGALQAGAVVAGQVSGSTFRLFSEGLSLPPADAYKVLAWNASGTALENRAIDGTGAMIAAVYDAEGKAEQVITIGDVGTVVLPIDAVISGDSELGFVPPAMPTVIRPLWAKLGDTFSALDAGLTNNSVDTTDAAQDLLTYSAANSCDVYFPAGRYLITDKITASMSGDKAFAWRGNGNGVTIIDLNTGGDGIEIFTPGNWWLDSAGGRSGLEISNMTLTTTNTHVGKGISIEGSCEQGRPHAPLRFNDLELRARSSISGQGFADWISLHNVSNAKLKHPVIRMASGATGTRGIVWYGDAQGNSPTDLRIDNPDITYGDIAIEAGNYCEGMYITHPEIVGAVTGIKYKPIIGESGLHILGGHISTSLYGLDLDNLFDWICSGALFYRSGTTANYNGIITRNGGRWAATGNVFKGTTGSSDETGLQVNSSVNNEKYGGLIDGNTFHSFAGRAIWLAANANYVSVGSANAYRECTVRILNQATNANNHIQPKIWGGTANYTLTGGAATENIDVPIPSGVALAGAGWICGNGTDLIGTYDVTNSTSTTARFVLRRVGGGNITAGSTRLNWGVMQSLLANTA